MIEFAVIGSAAAAYQQQRHESLARAEEERRRREHEAWEDETLLPAMAPDQRERFLAERRRLNERREDAARQERQHRERLAVEREKAAAIRDAGRRSDSSFLRGFIWGEILGGGR